MDECICELGSEGIEDCMYGGGEGEEEGVLAMGRDDGRLEVEVFLSLDGLFRCLCLVAAAQRHQRLVLVLLVRLQLEQVHF